LSLGGGGGFLELQKHAGLLAIWFFSQEQKNFAAVVVF